MHLNPLFELAVVRVNTLLSSSYSSNMKIEHCCVAYSSGENFFNKVSEFV